MMLRGLSFCGVLLIVSAAVGLLSCGEVTDGKTGHELAGTTWQLVEIQSMDDEIGTVRPDDASIYTMQLSADSTFSMRLNCNRANGSWSAHASDGGESGTFQFGRIAMTRAFCPPPSLDGRIAREADYVRSYLLKDGRLYLSLMADGGIHVWEPVTSDMTVATGSSLTEITAGGSTMQVYYLEIVTTDVDAVCAAYAGAHGVQFGDPVAELGNARTAVRHGGGLVGVRAPMHDAEEPVVRPYWLVEDIETAVKAVVSAGGEIAHPPLEIPGYGTFAIYFLGGNQHGLWQL